MINHTIVTDPTIRQPGFDLPRYASHTWSLMNRFRTSQGPYRAILHKGGLAQSPSCDCGQRQTMNYIVDTCPLTKFEGGLNLLHEADDDTVTWLESTSSHLPTKFLQPPNLHICITSSQFSLLAALVLHLWSHSLAHPHHLLYE